MAEQPKLFGMNVVIDDRLPPDRIEMRPANDRLLVAIGNLMTDEQALDLLRQKVREAYRRLPPLPR